MFTFILRGLLAGANLVSWSKIKAFWKAARGKVGGATTRKTVLLPTNTWAQRFWASFIGMFMIVEVADFIIGILSKGAGLGFLAFMKVWPDHGADVVAWAAKQITDFEPAAVNLAAETMTQITGVKIDPAFVKAVDNPEEGRTRAINLGGNFMQVVTAIFDVPSAMRDFQTRTGYVGSAQNLAAYFGTNLFFQLRSLTIGTVASMSGFGVLRHLEALHQSVNWAFGFGWLSWAVMSEYMNVTINPGMRRLLNGQVKPNDYSEAEARWAFWAGRLNSEEHLRIMDNQGVRADIRQPLLDRAEADLSDGDLLELYEHRLLSEDAIRAQYRLKGYGATKANLKVLQIKNNRTWGLLDKIADQYLNLYRDCVLQREFFEPTLVKMGWTQAEINSAIALKELERRQRKWLSEGELAKAVEQGFMVGGEAVDYMRCQGMTNGDAVLNLILMLQKKLPKDCFDKIEPIDLDKVFDALLKLLMSGELLSLPINLIKFLKCLGITDFPEPPGPGDDETRPALKLPTGSFNAIPSSPTVGEQFRLVWSIDRADTVEIDNGIGEQPAQGVMFLTATTNTIWKLAAENDDGKKTFQASILVKAKPEPKPAKLPLPTIQLQVSPSSIREGEQYAIQWETRNATQVFLDAGGRIQEVALSGAQFKVSDQSRVFTLTASGPGGQASRSDTQIVRAADPETAPTPRASLSVTPGHAIVGDRVEIKWSTANADEITLSGIGRMETVPATGVRIVTATADSIVTLRARNTETQVERIAVDALIVDAPEVPSETPEPKPTLSFSLRPSSAKKGATVAIEWRTTNATQVTLVRASGSVALDTTGALAIVANETEGMLMHAMGPGGSVAIAKVLIVV